VSGIQTDSRCGFNQTNSINLSGSAAGDGLVRAIRMVQATPMLSRKRRVMAAIQSSGTPWNSSIGRRNEGETPGVELHHTVARVAVALYGAVRCVGGNGSLKGDIQLFKVCIQSRLSS
jgi:hypothetical protein